MNTPSALLLLALVASCAPACAHKTTTIVKATSCREGHQTYLGFRGEGPAPAALLDEILKRFPDAEVLEFSDGNLGVLIAEPHSWEVRGRHEAAAAAVGWKGDVVDFAYVTKTCQASFHTPMPPP